MRLRRRRRRQHFRFQSFFSDELTIITHAHERGHRHRHQHTHSRRTVFKYTNSNVLFKIEKFPYFFCFSLIIIECCFPALFIHSRCDAVTNRKRPIKWLFSILLLISLLRRLLVRHLHLLYLSSDVRHAAQHSANGNKHLLNGKCEIAFGVCTV